MEKRYTIHEIKRANEAAGGKFFSRENLRFAGQTVKSFKVKHAGGRVFVHAPRYADQGKKRMGETIAEFEPATGWVRRILDKDVFSLADLEKFIEEIK